MDASFLSVLNGQLQLGSIFMACIFAGLGLWIAKKIRDKLLEISSKKSKKHKTLYVFFINIAYGVMFIICGIPLLGKLGVPTASLIALVSTSSLAIGLALKDFLGNIAAGVIIVFQRPFELGDLVELSGTFGTVDQIDLFTVRVRTPSNEAVYIPNGKLVKDKIINKAYKNRRRLELKVGVSYDSCIKTTKAVIMDLINSHPKILKDPEALVAVNDYKDSSIEIMLRVWVEKANFLEVKFYLLENILEVFKLNNIEIPFPQLDLAIKKSSRRESLSSTIAGKNLEKTEILKITES